MNLISITSIDTHFTILGILLVVTGYLSGSAPIAHYVATKCGVNIFETGTKNPGTANVYRTIGKMPGTAVFLGDVTKGAAPILLSIWAGMPSWFYIVVGFATVTGHWFPVFLKFRGGAGLATAIGVTYAIMPITSLIGTPFVLIALYLSHNTAWSAVLGYAVFIIAAYFLDSNMVQAVAIICLTGLTAIRQQLIPTSH